MSSPHFSVRRAKVCIMGYSHRCHRSRSNRRSNCCSHWEVLIRRVRANRWRTKWSMLSSNATRAVKTTHRGLVCKIQGSRSPMPPRAREKPKRILSKSSSISTRADTRSQGTERVQVLAEVRIFHPRMHLSRSTIYK